MQVIDVPAAQGGTWLKDAFALFRAQPAGWIVLTAAWLLLMLGSLLLPFTGGVIAVLQPAFFAGFALACRAQEQGGRVTVRHLFAALRLNPRPLVSIGAAIVIIDFLLLLALQFLLDAPAPPAMPAEAGPVERMQALIKGRELLLTLFFALDSLLRTLLWFAAPLLAFNRMSAWHAVRWSAYASLGNLPALAVFGLLMVLMFLLAAIPAGLGLIIALPLLAIANYTSYRRVFRES